jgi:hypothetical protein
VNFKNRVVFSWLYDSCVCNLTYSVIFLVFHGGKFYHTRCVGVKEGVIRTDFVKQFHLVGVIKRAFAFRDASEAHNS